MKNGKEKMGSMIKEMDALMFEYHRREAEKKDRAKNIKKIRCKKNLEKWLKRHIN